jgi:hypothetical protein
MCMESFENMNINSVLDIEVYSDIVWTTLNFTTFGLKAVLSLQNHLPELPVFVQNKYCNKLYFSKQNITLLYDWLVMLS